MSVSRGRRGALGPLALIIAVSGLPAQADWPQWRGPGRDGTAAGFERPARWPEVLRRLWRVEVGAGHASPLLVGDSVYVFSREGDEEVARRLERATGRQLWRTAYAAPYEMNPAARAHGKGPKSTPVYDDGRLFTLGISGVLSCLEADTGRVRWRHDFSGQYGSTSPLYGTAMSPVVDGGLLIAHLGGHDEGALTAFDARTGQLRWRWPGDGPAYASPIVVELDGVRQLVTQTRQHCVGVSLADGRLLWSFPFTTPWDQNCVTPVVAGDLIVFGGLRQPTFACRPRRRGERWEVARVWENAEFTLYMSTPVASGGWLHGMSDTRRGRLFTLDAATGEALWSGEGRLGDNAALLDAGAVLLVLPDDGWLRVLGKEGEALVEIARYQVAESATWASPAVEGIAILVKDVDTLSLWEVSALGGEG